MFRYSLSRLFLLLLHAPYVFCSYHLYIKHLLQPYNKCFPSVSSVPFVPSTSLLYLHLSLYFDFSPMLSFLFVLTLLFLSYSLSSYISRVSFLFHSLCYPLSSSCFFSVVSVCFLIHPIFTLPYFLFSLLEVQFSQCTFLFHFSLFFPFWHISTFRHSISFYSVPFAILFPPFLLSSLLSFLLPSPILFSSPLLSHPSLPISSYTLLSSPLVCSPFLLSSHYPRVSVLASFSPGPSCVKPSPEEGHKT